MSRQPVLTRVVLQNYKSLKTCDVELGPLTFLTGPNASGKSNFLDAIQFVADALAGSLEQAVESRGGITSVRHKGRADDPFVRFRLELLCPDGRRAHFAFELEHVSGGCRARREECVLQPLDSGQPLRYRVEDTSVAGPAPGGTTKTSGRELFLASKLVLPEFHIVRDLLAPNRVYHPEPLAMTGPTPFEGDAALEKDGNNLARALRHMKTGGPDAFIRVTELLKKFIPRLYEIDFKLLTDPPSVELVLLQTAPARRLWPLSVHALSHSQRRVLHILTALFQPAPQPLIGLDDLPGTLQQESWPALLDALAEAARSRQILAAISDDRWWKLPGLPPHRLLSFDNQDGDTAIAKANPSAGKVRIFDDPPSGPD